MPDITAEGYLWLVLIMGTVVLGAVAGLLSVPGIGFGASLRFGLAISAIAFGLAVVAIFWLRTGGFGCFGAIGIAIAVWGARNSWIAYTGLVRGERSLTEAERHVREVARKVYGEWIEEARLAFDDGGAAMLEFRLSSGAPIKEVRLNLTSLAEKYEAGLNDAVLERAIDVTSGADVRNR